MSNTELFKSTVEANKKYVALVNANDIKQLDQLEACKTYIDIIRREGLLNEYAEYIKAHN